MFRSPSAVEGQGGAMTVEQKKSSGSMIMLRDQVTDIAIENGLKSSVQALFPTPTVVDMGNNKSVDEWESWTEEQRGKHNNGNGHGASLSIEALKLLPTPNTMEHREIKTPEQIAALKEKSPGGYRNLREEVIHNLPTPIVRDYKDGQAVVMRDGKKQTDTLPREIMNGGEITDISWGKFEPAIRRWEQIIGRKAPAPTKPDGKDGAHRLSSEFAEWMMGLEPGWVTGVGLNRQQELKACGNGVVPQQAALALKILLGDYAEINSNDVKMLPTPTPSDVYIENLDSKQTKKGSMHSMNLAKIVNKLEEY